MAELAARLEAAAREADAGAAEATKRLAPAPPPRSRDRRLVEAVRRSDAGLDAKPVSYWHRTHISPTVGRPGLDLTSWRPARGGPDGMQLDLLNRYLLVGPDGRMGWTRLSKGCLGVVEVSQNPPMALQLDGLTCQFGEIRFFDPPARGGANVEFHLADPRSGQEVRVRANFVLNGFGGIQIGGQTKLAAALQRHFDESPAAMEAALAKVLLTPFKYEKRSRGENVVAFLGARPGQQYRLRLHRLRGWPFLVLDYA